MTDDLCADGRPAPLWPREVKRRQKQKELAVRCHFVTLYLKLAFLTELVYCRRDIACLY